MGVDLFFVLSGYLIGTQLLRPYLNGERPRFWGFYRRRLYRVLPAYLVVLALYFLWPMWREAPGISPLWQFLTFTENLFVDYGKNQAFSHVWSLCVEEHFYLLLPLIVAWMMRKPSVAKTVGLLGGVVLMGICIRSFVLLHTLRPMVERGESFGVVYIERIYYPTYTRLDGLVAGVTLALVKGFRPGWWDAVVRRGNSLLFGGACLVGIAVWLLKDRMQSVYGVSGVGTVIGFPVLSLGLGLAVASAVSSNGILNGVRVPGAKLIAMLAYSLYLTHKEVLRLDEHYFRAVAEMGGMAFFGVYAVTTLAVAGALYLCVERPFMVLRDRRQRRRELTLEQEIRVEPAL
jgi:peptidoglycan/LPS O-acetylase OafA/YrhL